MTAIQRWHTEKQSAWLYRVLAQVEKDPARAYQLFQRACDGGNAVGCSWQAWHLQHGAGIARDQDSARPLYQRACDDGAAASSWATLTRRGPWGRWSKLRKGW